MSRCGALPLALLLLAAPAAAQGFADDLDAVLGAAVTEDGRVRYGVVRGALRERLDRALDGIAEQDPAALRTDAGKLAFWANAYNAHVLAAVADRPAARHLEREGLFEALFKTPVAAARQRLTLDEIEHVVLRRQPGRAALEALAVGTVDPRVHVALNCAAVSCPPLGRRAFRAATLDRTLDAAMRAWVNGRAFEVTDDGVVASSLFDWFAADFDAAGGGDYVLGYLDPQGPGAEPIRRSLRDRTLAEVKGLPGVRFAYDWTVNRAP